jgi:hypothetical protein
MCTYFNSPIISAFDKRLPSGAVAFAFTVQMYACGQDPRSRRSTLTQNAHDVLSLGNVALQYFVPGLQRFEPLIHYLRSLGVHSIHRLLEVPCQLKRETGPQKPPEGGGDGGRKWKKREEGSEPSYLWAASVVRKYEINVGRLGLRERGWELTQPAEWPERTLAPPFSPL